MTSTAQPAAPTVSLRHGAEMPVLGLGTWPMDNRETADAVAAAIGAGYRMVDTAENYGNEEGVGEGIRRSGIDRAEIFITSKFNRSWHSVDGVRRAFEDSSRRLGVGYIDLFLIHWPNPGLGQFIEAMKGLDALRADGLIRAAGVSNFKTHHLRALFDAGLVPEVNQVQLDPRHTRTGIRELDAARGIVTESWSPLGRNSGLLDDPLILELAAKYGRTPSQIVLRWHTQLGLVATPKSGNPARLKENIGIFDFTLDDDDLQRVSSLDAGEGGILDSDQFGH
ncbi:MAG: aldo/keto reductase [Actinomycetales bacterium]